MLTTANSIHIFYAHFFRHLVSSARFVVGVVLIHFATVKLTITYIEYEQTFIHVNYSHAGQKWQWLNTKQSTEKLISVHILHPPNGYFEEGIFENSNIKSKKDQDFKSHKWTLFYCEKEENEKMDARHKSNPINCERMEIFS